MAAPLDVVLRPLAWALIHFLWQGTLVTLCLWGSLRVLRHNDSRARYAVSCAALVMMAALPLLTLMIADPAPVAAPALSSNSARGSSGPLDAALPWVVAAWITGVLLVGSRHVSAWLGLRRWMESGSKRVDENILARFETMARRSDRATGASGRIDPMDVPATIGFLRPVVVVPVSVLTGVSAPQLDALLAHELAHVRRHDYLINLLQVCVETVLFYHPAVWWVSRQIRIERENCCDDVAVNLCEDRRAYVEALTTLETMRGMTMAMSANGGSLLSRVRRLLGEGNSQGSSSAPALVAVLLLLAGLTAGLYACDSPTDSPNAAKNSAVAEDVQFGHGNTDHESLSDDTLTLHLEDGGTFELKRPEGMTDAEFKDHVHKNLQFIAEQHGEFVTDHDGAPHAVFIDESAQEEHDEIMQQLVELGLIEEGKPAFVEAREDGSLLLNGEEVDGALVEDLKKMIHEAHGGHGASLELENGWTWEEVGAEGDNETP